MKKKIINFAVYILNMIQRKQSIYLFIAGLLSAVFAGITKVKDVLASWFSSEEEIYVTLAFVISAILSFITIFLYKRRKLQLKLDGLNLLLNVLIIVYFIYSLLNLPGGFQPEKGIWFIVPVLSIVFLFIANRSIKKDEELVKSVDRFR